MIKIRKKLIREKVVICVYQYLLLNSNIDDFLIYLEDPEKPRLDKNELEISLDMLNKIVENLDSYNSIISKNIKETWTIDRLSKIEHAILIVCIYENQETEEHKNIIINEAVLLTKKYCDEDAYKYINGVLNKAL